MRIIGNDPSVPRQTQEVASGTLPNGKPVIVNADGTVAAAGNVATSASAGTQVVFEAAQVPSASVVYDSSNNKTVICYRDAGDSNKGKAVVGTVSGSTISFGTPVEFESGVTPYIRATFDSSSNKVVIAYVDQDDSNKGKAIVGTVSGTSISFGSAALFKNGTVGAAPGICFDSTKNKVVVFYRNSDNSFYGTAKVGTVSGTAISFSGASDVVFNSGNTRLIKSVFDAASGKTVTVFRDYGDSSKGKAIVGTVGETDISFGSEVEFVASGAGIGGLAYDSNTEKTVVSFYDEDDSSKGKSRVGTVSGTSISFGTAVVFDTAVSTHIDSTFDPTTNKVIIVHKDGSDNIGKFTTGTVSGTSISFDSDTQFSSSDANPFDVTYDTNAKKAIVVFDNPTGGNSGDATVITPSGNYPNLTSENYIGISRSGAADTKGAIIDTQGAIADIPVINYILSSASYDNVRFNSSSQDGRMSGVAFNTDGTKMYLVGTDNDAVYQYNLSTAFNVSTASYNSVTLSISSQSVFPSAIEFNNDGTKMFIGSSNTNGVFQYSLSSGFDLSTASYDSVSFNPSSQESNVQGIQFNNDGTKMYIIGTANNTVFQYSLSTAFNLSSASYDSVSFSVASQNTSAQGLEFNNDGTKLFVVDNEPTEEVYQYDLTSGFDISTASYSNIKLDVSSQDSGTYGISFNADGSKMYLAGQDTDYIYQYSTSGSSLTAGQSYFVQTDGTLGTTAADPSVFAGTAVSATKLIVKG